MGKKGIKKKTIWRSLPIGSAGNTTKTNSNTEVKDRADNDNNSYNMKTITINNNCKISNDSTKTTATTTTTTTSSSELSNNEENQNNNNNSCNNINYTKYNPSSYTHSHNNNHHYNHHNYQQNQTLSSYPYKRRPFTSRNTNYNTGIGGSSGGGGSYRASNYRSYNYNDKDYSSYKTTTTPPSTVNGNGTGGTSGITTTTTTFNEDEYTRITTPRQDVLFKKGYLSRPKKYSTQFHHNNLNNNNNNNVDLNLNNLNNLNNNNTDTNTTSSSGAVSVISTEESITPNTDSDPDYSYMFPSYVDPNGVIFVNPYMSNGFDPYGGQMMMLPYTGANCQPLNVNHYEFYDNMHLPPYQNHKRLSIDSQQNTNETSSPQTEVSDLQTVTDIINNDELSENCNEKTDVTPIETIAKNEHTPENPNCQYHNAAMQPYYSPVYYPYVYGPPSMMPLNGMPYSSNQMQEYNVPYDNSTGNKQFRFKKRKRKPRKDTNSTGEVTTENSEDELTDNEENDEGDAEEYLNTGVEHPKTIMSINSIEFLPNLPSLITPPTTPEIEIPEIITEINTNLKELKTIILPSNIIENSSLNVEVKEFLPRRSYKQETIDKEIINNNNNNNINNNAFDGEQTIIKTSDNLQEKQEVNNKNKSDLVNKKIIKVSETNSIKSTATTATTNHINLNNYTTNNNELKYSNALKSSSNDAKGINENGIVIQKQIVKSPKEKKQKTEIPDKTVTKAPEPIVIETSVKPSLNLWQTVRPKGKRGRHIKNDEQWDDELIKEEEENATVDVVKTETIVEEPEIVTIENKSFDSVSTGGESSLTNSIQSIGNGNTNSNGKSNNNNNNKKIKTKNNKKNNPKRNKVVKQNGFEVIEPEFTRNITNKKLLSNSNLLDAEIADQEISDELLEQVMDVIKEIANEKSKNDKIEINNKLLNGNSIKNCGNNLELLQKNHLITINNIENNFVKENFVNSFNKIQKKTRSNDELCDTTDGNKKNVTIENTNPIIVDNKLLMKNNYIINDNEKIIDLIDVESISSDLSSDDNDIENNLLKINEMLIKNENKNDYEKDVVIIDEKFLIKDETILLNGYKENEKNLFNENCFNLNQIDDDINIKKFTVINNEETELFDNNYINNDVKLKQENFHNDELINGINLIDEHQNFNLNNNFHLQNNVLKHSTTESIKCDNNVETDKHFSKTILLKNENNDAIVDTIKTNINSNNEFIKENSYEKKFPLTDAVSKWLHGKQKEKTPEPILRLPSDPVLSKKIGMTILNRTIFDNKLLLDDEYDDLTTTTDSDEYDIDNDNDEIILNGNATNIGDNKNLIKNVSKNLKSNPLHVSSLNSSNEDVSFMLLFDNNCKQQQQQLIQLNDNDSDYMSDGQMKQQNDILCKRVAKNLINLNNDNEKLLLNNDFSYSYSSSTKKITTIIFDDKNKNDDILEYWDNENLTDENIKKLLKKNKNIHEKKKIRGNEVENDEDDNDDDDDDNDNDNEDIKLIHNNKNKINKAQINNNKLKLEKSKKHNFENDLEIYDSVYGKSINYNNLLSNHNEFLSNNIINLNQSNNLKKNYNNNDKVTKINSISSTIDDNQINLIHNLNDNNYSPLLDYNNTNKNTNTTTIINEQQQKQEPNLNSNDNCIKPPLTEICCVLM